MSISSKKKTGLKFYSNWNFTQVQMHSEGKKVGISQKTSVFYRLFKKVFILVFVSQTTPV